MSKISVGERYRRFDQDISNVKAEMRLTTLTEGNTTDDSGHQALFSSQRAGIGTRSSKFVDNQNKTVQFEDSFGNTVENTDSSDHEENNQFPSSASVVRPLAAADGSLLYFSAVRLYQSLSKDQEKELVCNLENTETKLRSVLAQIPGCSQALLEQYRLQNKGTRTGPQPQPNPDFVFDNFKDQLFRYSAQKNISEGASPTSSLSESMTVLEPDQKKVAWVDIQMKRLSDVHRELFAALARYPASHPICYQFRSRLASQFFNLPLSPIYVSLLAQRLIALSSDLPNSERCTKGKLTRTDSSGFERTYGIRFDDFNQIVNRVVTIYREWQRARNTLAEIHLGLVVYIAKRYQSDGIDFLDLVQEGNIGLIKAVERFDYQSGCQFSTYATYWIRLEISRFVARSNHLVRLPYRLYEKLRHVKHQVEIFYQSAGRLPTLAELARNTGIEVSELVEALSSSQAVKSLDSPLEGDENLNLLSQIEQRVVTQPEVQAEFESRKEVIESALNQLSKREACIVRNRFGIGTLKECTLQEIGDLLGLTRERVRQIEAGALKKLRARMRKCKLG